MTTDTARALDREIAERLGYKIYTEPVRNKPAYWVIRNPQGLIVADKCKSLEVAIEIGLPNWQDDLNAAMTLVQHAQPAYFTLQYSPDRMNWRAEFAFDYRKDIFADAKEPAHAIVLAWLDWLAALRTVPAPTADGEEAQP